MNSLGRNDAEAFEMLVYGRIKKIKIEYFGYARRGNMYRLLHRWKKKSGEKSTFLVVQPATMVLTNIYPIV